MPHLSLTENEALFYLHSAPETSHRETFVFFNALTGDTNLWEASIAPRLREKGYGTLTFDYRGQTQSTFSAEGRLTSQGIVEDAVHLLDHVGPANPVLVGLSIGGLYAARVWLEGAAADRLVLINTLRCDGPRLQWIGDALVRAAEIGGLGLFRDMFLPLLMNEQWLKDNRDSFLAVPAAYEPLPSDSGTCKLLAEAGSTADWDLPYEKLTLPTLVVTGLQDHVFLESDVVDRLFKRLPSGRRVDLPDAGHLIPGERPDAIVDILDEFAMQEER